MESWFDFDQPSALELTAHHEAGHAVAAVTLNIKFNYVLVTGYPLTSQPGSNIGGVVFDEPDPGWLPHFDPGNPEHQRTAENWVMLVLAGEAAESFREERECNIRRPSARGDYEIAIKWAKQLHADSDACEAFLEKRLCAACAFVRDRLRERQIGVVASHLKVRRELTFANVVALMEEMKESLDDRDVDMTDKEH